MILHPAHFTDLSAVLVHEDVLHVVGDIVGALARRRATLTHGVPRAAPHGPPHVTPRGPHRPHHPLLGWPWGLWGPSPAWLLDHGGPRTAVLEGRAPLASQPTVLYDPPGGQGALSGHLAWWGPRSHHVDLGSHNLGNWGSGQQPRKLLI